MKRTILLSMSLLMALVSCKKDNSLKNIVFEGKYLGEGCWPVIQVLKPSLSNVGIDPSETKWLTYLSSVPSYHDDTTYFGAVGVGVGTVPDSLKNGDPFYFKVTKIMRSPGHVMDCTIPKYSFYIKVISKGGK